MPKITLEDLTKEHSSKLRNPKISTTFYKRGMIEQWGRGTNLIQEACLHAGHHEPKFLERADYFYVIMHSKYTMSSSKRQDFYSNLSKRQQEIIALLDSYKDGIAAKEIQQKIVDINSATTLKRELRLLTASNLIYSRGSGKSTVWLLRKEDNENTV